MKRFSVKEGLVALSLIVSPVAGYGFEAAVKAGVQSTRDEIAALSQGVELNSLAWGGGLLQDPTNYWTQAMQGREK